ncbi:ATP-binding protein [Streptomyces sp. NPDC006997]|uniref:ATP-binding protein n=1 Tax=Streptomyces sp. NPDC006997 TaxID=3155356 RepID=UPI00340E153F
MLKPLRQGLPPLDPAAVSSASSCALSARYEAVREARRFTRVTLEQWGIDERFDDICLVVSELVTNALRHAVPATAPECGGNGSAGHFRSQGAGQFAGQLAGQEPPVRLHLMRWTERLVCAVRDPSDGTPVARDTEDFSAESGRGLFLVESFCDSWGWHPLAGTLTGKVVWALFRLQPPEGGGLNGQRAGDPRPGA